MNKKIIVSCICVAQGLVLTTAHADFIKDSETTLQLRNFYVDRDYDGNVVKDHENWSQSASLIAKSGYTDDELVQVGLDASIRYAVRLNEDKHAPNYIMPYDPVTQTQDPDQLKLGGTLKLKKSKSELKIDEIIPKNPVLHTDESRQLPTTFLGAVFESSDIQDTKLTLGHITKVNARDDDHYKDLSLTNGKIVAHSDGFNMFGVEHKFTPQITGTYFYGGLEDIYNQHFAGVTYQPKFSDNLSLRSDLYYFNTRDTGDSAAGKIDNDVISTLNVLTYGNHKFGLGYRQQFGETGYPALNGWVPQLYLANWTVSVFSKPKERSFQFRYDYDMKGIGLDGLNLLLRYYTADNAHVGEIRDGKEDELDVLLSYKIPETYIKGLNFQWLYAKATTDFGPDFTENRVALTYNYKF